MRHLSTRSFSIRKALTITLASIGLSIGASAPGVAQPLPSYATGEESISGRIVSLDGSYRLALHDDRGFIDNVRLHDGTIINPTGLRLAPGQSVKILGHANGKTFDANEIDTPYARYPAERFAYSDPYLYGPYPYGPYPGGYGYPYPVPGPRFGFGFGFRDRGFGFGGRI